MGNHTHPMNISTLPTNMKTAYFKSSNLLKLPRMSKPSGQEKNKRKMTTAVFITSCGIFFIVISTFNTLFVNV